MPQTDAEFAALLEHLAERERHARLLNRRQLAQAAAGAPGSARGRWG